MGSLEDAGPSGLGPQTLSSRIWFKTQHFGSFVEDAWREGFL